MKALLTALSLGSLLVTAAAVDLTATGHWNEVLDAGDLSSGAGSKLVSQFTSPVGASTLEVSNAAGSTWRILARRADNGWDTRLTLAIRRTSTGSGSGFISGGESFIQLTNIDREIFSGSGDRSAISIQAQLSGVSVDISPDVYSAGIIFTVVP